MTETVHGVASAYPAWVYYPTNARPPGWSIEFLQVVSTARSSIDSEAASGLTSNVVLETLRPGLEGLGFEVESGKESVRKIRRPVLYGPQGVERVSYEVDGVHDGLGAVLEIEAGRGAMSNAIYRDLIRASLLVDVKYLVLGVMLTYRFANRGRTAISRQRILWTPSTRVVVCSSHSTECFSSGIDPPSRWLPDAGWSQIPSAAAGSCFLARRVTRRSAGTGDACVSGPRCCPE